MMAKPIRALELYYLMIQFLIILDRELFHTNLVLFCRTCNARHARRKRASFSRSTPGKRVLKCDVIKMNFWNYGICQNILKEQCRRGLLAQNEHFAANCLWDRSPVMLRKLHTNGHMESLGRPPKKFRRACMEFSKHNVYGKRQTSDSSWEFLRIENEQLKTIIMDNKLLETTYLSVEVMNSKRHTSTGETWSRGTNSRLPFDVNVMLNLSNTKLVISKGYGVWVTTIEGQNAFAPTLCFA